MADSVSVLPSVLNQLTALLDLTASSSNVDWRRNATRRPIVPPASVVTGAVVIQGKAALMTRIVRGALPVRTVSVSRPLNVEVLNSVHSMSNASMVFVLWSLNVEPIVTVMATVYA